MSHAIFVTLKILVTFFDLALTFNRRRACAYAYVRSRARVCVCVCALARARVCASRRCPRLRYRSSFVTTTTFAARQPRPSCPGRHRSRFGHGPVARRGEMWTAAPLQLYRYTATVAASPNTSVSNPHAPGVAPDSNICLDNTQGKFRINTYDVSYQ